MQTSPVCPVRMVSSSLPHLVALKLFTGGASSTSEVASLLRRNEVNGTLDISAVRDFCHRYMLGPKLESVLKQIGYA